VRLDGYWALTDLTGIPDFFSQMGPFLRSILPISEQEDGKLPGLKPWVRTVFAVYIMVTVPLLTEVPGRGVLGSFMSRGLHRAPVPTVLYSIPSAESYKVRRPGGGTLP